MAWVRPIQSRGSKSKGSRSKGKSKSEVSLAFWSILVVILSIVDWSCFMYVVYVRAVYFQVVMTIQPEESNSF